MLYQYSNVSFHLAINFHAFSWQLVLSLEVRAPRRRRHSPCICPLSEVVGGTPPYLGCTTRHHSRADPSHAHADRDIIDPSAELDISLFFSLRPPLDGLDPVCTQRLGIGLTRLLSNSFTDFHPTRGQSHRVHAVCQATVMRPLVSRRSPVVREATTKRRRRANAEPPDSEDARTPPSRLRPTRQRQ